MYNKTFAGIDYFRFIAAFFVIAIHISPLSVLSEGIDYLITYCIGRIAVPFFFMTTGYFVLARYILILKNDKYFLKFYKRYGISELFMVNYRHDFIRKEFMP